MDIIEINKLTQKKKVENARNEMYENKRKVMGKESALCLILYACTRMYGVKLTAMLLHSIGVDKISANN